MISSQDRPRRVMLTWLHELPFGKGKLIPGPSSKVLGGFIGGWQAQGIFTLRSGAALGFGNSIFNGDLDNIRLRRRIRAE